MTTPGIGTVLAVSVIEGLLMPLAVLPIVRLLPGSRRRVIASGVTLTMLGGVVPLVQASTLPLVLRVASAIEILAQKFPTGVAIARWLGPDPEGSVRD